jgi:hypothetical protein
MSGMEKGDQRLRVDQRQMDVHFAAVHVPTRQRLTL